MFRSDAVCGLPSTALVAAVFEHCVYLAQVSPNLEVVCRDVKSLH